MHPHKINTVYENALELAGGDSGAAVHLLELIVDTNRITQAQLRDGFHVRDWDQVASAAHRIAGSARMLDRAGLLVLLTHLEAAARVAQAASAENFFLPAMREIEALERAIHAALGK